MFTLEMTNDMMMFMCVQISETIKCTLPPNTKLFGPHIWKASMKWGSAWINITIILHNIRENFVEIILYFIESYVSWIGPSL